MIHVEDVKKVYQMGPVSVHALRGVSFEIKEGELVAIMGPSGSGKSTIMNVLGCLDRPSSGTYRLNGVDVKKLSDDELAKLRNKEIGFVFQQFHLLPRISLLQNVELPLLYAGASMKVRRKKAMEALEVVGLSDRMDHNPNEVSGGQKQRAAIARALVNDPSIILADEPTGNLDSKTGDMIMELFVKLHSLGKTIILVTHDPEICGYARRVIRLRDGLLVSDEINQNPRTRAEEGGEISADIRYNNDVAEELKG
jgi:putative ABC transport system ATP-binding protein